MMTPVLFQGPPFLAQPRSVLLPVTLLGVIVAVGVGVGVDIVDKY